MRRAGGSAGGNGSVGGSCSACQAAPATPPETGPGCGEWPAPAAPHAPPAACSGEVPLPPSEDQDEIRWESRQGEASVPRAFPRCSSCGNFSKPSKEGLCNSCSAMQLAERWRAIGSRTESAGALPGVGMTHSSSDSRLPCVRPGVASTASPPRSGGIESGAEVEADSEWGWLPARIVDIRPDGRVKVRYEGKAGVYTLRARQVRACGTPPSGSAGGLPAMSRTSEAAMVAGAGLSRSASSGGILMAPRAAERLATAERERMQAERATASEPRLASSGGSANGGSRSGGASASAFGSSPSRLSVAHAHFNTRALPSISEPLSPLQVGREEEALQSNHTPAAAADAIAASALAATAVVTAVTFASLPCGTLSGAAALPSVSSQQHLLTAELADARPAVPLVQPADVGGLAMAAPALAPGMAASTGGLPCVRSPATPPNIAIGALPWVPVPPDVTIQRGATPSSDAPAEQLAQLQSRSKKKSEKGRGPPSHCTEHFGSEAPHGGDHEDTGSSLFPDLDSRENRGYREEHRSAAEEQDGRLRRGTDGDIVRLRRDSSRNRRRVPTGGEEAQPLSQEHLPPWKGEVCPPEEECGELEQQPVVEDHRQEDSRWCWRVKSNVDVHFPSVRAGAAP